MLGYSLRWNASCPSCQAKIWWYHLLASTMAPFYFKCPRCKTKLRLSQPQQVVKGYLFPLAGLFLVLFLGIFLAAGTSLWKMLVAVTLGFLVFIIFLGLYPLQGNKIRLREPRLAVDPAARKYLLTGLVTLALTYLPLLALATAILVKVALLGIVPWRSGPAFPSVSELSSLGEVNGDWTVRTLEGTEVKWSSFHGKVVFVNFWATWCPPCLAEMPDIEALYQSMRDSDVAFLVISREQDQDVRTFVEMRQWKLPFYLAQGELPAVFRTDGIPATFIVNRRGEVVFRQIGKADWDTDECRAFLRSIP